MYYLGIDPGLSEVGFGIIKVINEEEPVYVDCGIFKTPANLTLAERLSMIKYDLEELFRLHKFEAAGIEELFFVKNITNGMKVAHARGVILQSLQEKKFSIYEMKPSEIKSNICGSGNADKRQVQDMVKRLLSLGEVPKPHDAADALGIAILTARLHKG